MRTNILRHVAVALGLSFCAVAPTAMAQSNYAAPSKWSNFNAPQQSSSSVFRTVSTGETLSAPVQDAMSSGSTIIQNQMSHQAAPVMNAPMAHAPMQHAPMQHAPMQHAPMVQSSMGAPGCAPCQNNGGVSYGSPYAQAVQSPWTGSAPTTTYHSPVGSYGAPTCNAHGYSGRSTHGRRSLAGRRGGLLSGNLGGGRGPINPYFGGASLLFWDLEENSDRTLLVDDAGGFKRLGTAGVGPDSHTGFNVHGGRYLNNGCQALDFGYLYFDPDRSERLFTGLGGSYRAALPAFRDVTSNTDLDGDGTNESVYDVSSIDADGFRVRRDLRIQGLEANLVTFGLMGARRLGSCGYGGSAGPLVRPSQNRVQIQTSHGFRWFQLEDELEFAGNVDGVDGYQPADAFYNVDTENNLYGYQFGSKLTYCLNSRLNLNVGGKIGIYGNDVTVRQRITDNGGLAYLSASGTDDVNTRESDTVFSALGELDLGLGYRVNNAWTVTGGYRMLTACGVATSTGSIINDFTSLDSVGAVNADDCIILHGGYVGLQYNW